MKTVKTLKTNPELMTVICNIIAMKEKIDKNFNQHVQFDYWHRRYEHMTEDELYKIQLELIDLYNLTFKK